MRTGRHGSFGLDESKVHSVGEEYRSYRICREFERCDISYAARARAREPDSYIKINDLLNSCFFIAMLLEWNAVATTVLDIFYKTKIHAEAEDYFHPSPFARSTSALARNIDKSVIVDERKIFLSPQTRACTVLWLYWSHRSQATPWPPLWAYLRPST